MASSDGLYKCELLISAAVACGLFRLLDKWFKKFNPQTHYNNFPAPLARSNKWRALATTGRSTIVPSSAKAPCPFS